jgi:K+-transporting ATPase ATPase C chain
MKEQIRASLLTALIFTIILGIAYPLLVWVVGQTFLPVHSNGSVIKDSSGRVIGSKFIGQNFSSVRYFHSRPSFAGNNGYDAMASSASNLGPTSKKLVDLLEERIEIYRLENQISPDQKIPIDAITASGSGLDPHISLSNAYLQTPRIAAARNAPLSSIRDAIRTETSRRWLGIFGEKHVNVLLLNMKIDRLFPASEEK